MTHALRSPLTSWGQFLSLLAITIQLSGCALFEERTGPTTFYGPRDQVYLANFEEVWRAVNLVLQPYPLRISNMDQGTLETDMIHGYKVWGPVYKSDTASTGESYRMTIHVVKGALKSHVATKVNIVKDTEVQVDFFSDPKNLPSDGLEEKMILYRIGREIQIERALAKAQKQHNQDQNQDMPPQ